MYTSVTPERLAVIVCFLPVTCFAGTISGRMSAWELFWWTGGSEYPSQWWHGLGPIVAIFVLVVFTVSGAWYLFRRARG